MKHLHEFINEELLWEENNESELKRNSDLSAKGQLKAWLKGQKYENYIGILNQILSQHSDILDAFTNDKYGEIKLKNTTENISVNNLFPTQNEIDVSKSLSFGFGKVNNDKKPDKKIAKNNLELYYGDKPIKLGFPEPVPLIAFTNDNKKYYVIDGHHRWSQVFCWNPNAKMECLVFENKNLTPIDMLKITQGVIAQKVAKTSKEIPVSHVDGSNLFTISENDLTNTLNKYKEEYDKVIGEKWIDLYKSINSDIKNPIKEVVNNCVDLKEEHKPAEGSPERGYMPQTDNKNAEGALDLLKTKRIVNVSHLKSKSIQK